jgi:hypothetical protein
MATLAEMIADAIAEHERVCHGPVSGCIVGDRLTQEQWDRLCKEGVAINYSDIREELTKQQMNADIVTIGV